MWWCIDQSEIYCPASFLSFTPVWPFICVLIFSLTLWFLRLILNVSQLVFNNLIFANLLVVVFGWIEWLYLTFPLTCRCQVKLKLFSITFFQMVGNLCIEGQVFCSFQAWPTSKTVLMLKYKCRGAMLLMW